MSSPATASVADVSRNAFTRGNVNRTHNNSAGLFETDMSSPATASVADVSRNAFTRENVNRTHNNSGVSAAQCPPVPLPALGIQRITRGNGTDVGTVISLQCPARHRLMGGHMECVMGPNVTQWNGESYCKPLSSYEDYGFRVAVVASIVSSAIILIMSMAFITCCLVDCLNRDKKRHQEREKDFRQREGRVEQEQQQQSASRCSNKGRNNNNNNNNTGDNPLSLWDDHDPELGDISICRCRQRYPCEGLISAPSSPCTLAPTPPAFPLPGHGYDQPLLSQSSSDPAQRSGSSQRLAPPRLASSRHQHYPAGPYWSSCQPQNSGLDQSSAPLVRQHGRAGSSVSADVLDESCRMNMHSAREPRSIRIISV